MADDAGRDAEVEHRLADLDALLERVEQIPGPSGELALEAVAAVVEIYGAALSRALLLARSPEAFTSDPLLGHLLLVHGLHPDPVDVRVRRALEEVGARLGPHGASLELLGIAGGMAEVRVTGGGGCGTPSSAELDEALREILLAEAPELVRVETVAGDTPRTVAFVPLDSLLRSPARPEVPA
jgi:Fe-S cluster biogenesis protein NfuA